MIKEVYNIHIYRTKEYFISLILNREIIYVAAFSEKSTEMFLIELPKPKSSEVLVTFKNSYEFLCDNLDI